MTHKHLVCRHLKHLSFAEKNNVCRLHLLIFVFVEVSRVSVSRALFPLNHRRSLSLHFYGPINELHLNFSL